MSKSKSYWEELSKKIQSPEETKNKRPDTSDIEVDFLCQYLEKDSDVLDIGSGSGLIVNKLVDKVKHITAVEKFEGFTQYIEDHPNMLVINADLIGFKIRRQYDVVLCSGVTQYFPKKETKGVYQNIFEMVKSEGKFIARSHCGLEEDVVVDGYSEELETNYFAEYRHIDKEVELLKEIGFSEVQTFDIFPDSTNVWENTRHFVIVCHKS